MLACVPVTLLLGCGASASQDVRGALAKGDVRGALVAYERIDADDRASLSAIARAVLQDGAVVAVDRGVRLGQHFDGASHATSKSVGCCARLRSSSRALRMRSAASMRCFGSNSS